MIRSAGCYCYKLIRGFAAFGQFKSKNNRQRCEVSVYLLRHELFALRKSENELATSETPTSFSVKSTSQQPLYATILSVARCIFTANYLTNLLHAFCALRKEFMQIKKSSRTIENVLSCRDYCFPGKHIELKVLSTEYVVVQFFGLKFYFSLFHKPLS